MVSNVVAAFLATALFLCSAGAFAAAQYKIVTASARGTYIQIGRDIAKLVGPDAGIDLEVLPSAGSAENVQRMRYEPGVKLALVQSDVYQAFLDEAASGNADAGAMIRPLRVIIPLYNEEIYFIVRSDSALNYVHEIKDAKINVGPLRSGTAMSATTIYRQMFGAPIAENRVSFMSNEDALVKLIGDKSVDVVVVVAGQPAKLLVD
ncbi:MAG TPA: TAXI family TRAP transporter solute-binding subunit, partial [Albitalea sp.]|nr:TAXI family TRAP transporter solute-binding subunit [Albitalea sp.]